MVFAENSHQTSSHLKKNMSIFYVAKTIQYLRSGAQNTTACWHSLETLQKKWESSAVTKGYSLELNARRLFSGGGGAKAPQWARASSFTRFLDHTQRHTAVVRTSLDEWSVAETSTWQYTTLTTDIHAPGGIRTPQFQHASGRRPTV